MEGDGALARLRDDMDQLFQGILGRFGLATPRLPSLFEAARELEPAIEVFQRGDKLVVRADLPGTARDDVRVEIAGDMLRIEGQRRQEREESDQGFYRSEVVYGSFSRTIPLPEGARAEDATATFRDGVLEIEIPFSRPSSGKRIEVR